MADGKTPGQGNGPSASDRPPARDIRRAGLFRRALSPWIYHGYRLFIAGMFLYAGTIKLMDTAGFGQSIAAYGILPSLLVPCAAMGLPAIEAAAGLGTLLNRRWGILAVTAMMALFIGVVGYGAAKGLDIDCGCFSTGQKAPAPSTAPAPLDLSGPEGQLGEGGIALVVPDTAGAGADGSCAEAGKGDGGAKLRKALYRDIALFVGVLYLVFWPDLRRRYLRVDAEGQSPAQ